MFWNMLIIFGLTKKINFILSIAKYQMTLKLFKWFSDDVDPPSRRLQLDMMLDNSTNVVKQTTSIQTSPTWHTAIISTSF